MLLVTVSVNVILLVKTLKYGANFIILSLFLTEVICT